MSQRELAANEGGYTVDTADAMWSIATGLDIRENAAAAIDYKHVECVNTGLGIRIIQALGTMFTEPDQSWMWIDSEDLEGEPIEDVEQLMTDVRGAGKFGNAVTELDMLSCMVESGFLHLYYKGDQIKYNVVTPNNVTIKFGSKLVYEDDNGDKTPSWVDYSDIDDASAVIIRTADKKGDYDSSPDESQYLAYVGCCEDRPEGRYVIYRAREPWPIPEVGDKNIDYEHMEGGVACNPLTWLRHHGTDAERQLVTTEYPIVLWRGGHRILSDEWPPITTSLYEDCLELEIGWSRVLRYAMSGARGQDVFKLASSNTRMPKSLDVIALDDNDDYMKTGWPASNSKDASSVLSIITEQTAGGFNVPGYMVIGTLSGMNPPSGISLAIQTAPLVSFRKRRQSLNQDASHRLFEIERAMLVQRYPSEAGGLLTPTIKQRWNPGEWRMPASDLEDTQATTAKLDAGLVDQVHAVKREHRLATDNEAEALIEQMSERDPGYTGGAAPPKQSFGFGGQQPEEPEPDEDDEE